MSAPPYPAELYAALHRGNPGDVDFYRHACTGATRVLELGCGDGRVLLALAEDGRELWGLDLHDGLLERGRAQAKAAGVDAHFVEGDMLDWPAELAELRFERITIPHGGLYCLLGEGELARVLDNCARALVPGGELLFDVWAADDFHADADPEDQAPSWQDHLGRFEIEGRDWEIIERSSWDPARQRIDVVYTHVPVGSYEAIEGHLPQRYFLRPELEAALAAAGFEPPQLHGDFAGAPYDAEAELMVGRARRL